MLHIWGSKLCYFLWILTGEMAFQLTRDSENLNRSGEVNTVLSTTSEQLPVLKNQERGHKWKALRWHSSSVWMHFSKLLRM